MMLWKLLWQVLFVSGFIAFIGMFILFGYRGYYELLDLLKGRNEE